MQIPLQTLQNVNPMAIYFSVNLMLSISTVFPYCYGSTLTLRSMERNAEKVYNLKWYKLPAKQKSDVRFLIQYAQRERNIRGYGFLSCEIPTFLKVNSTKM